MDKKNKPAETKAHLRLVKTTEADASQETSKNPQYRSALAQSMNNFADQLDRMIEQILQS